MSHSYAQNHIHLVFGTKERQKLIAKAMQRKLWAYMAGICKSYNILVFAIGGLDDHAHALFRLPPTIALARAVSLIKANSSRWMSDQGVRFSWQKGYGAFSVSSSNLSTVIKYVENQEAHHAKMSFEKEFIALLDRHGVSYDPKSVFE
jgi:putative transposase